MRNLLQTAMKHYLRCELLKARHRLGLTQEQMAARLWMSTRGYTALEGVLWACDLSAFPVPVLPHRGRDKRLFGRPARHFRGYRAEGGLRACCINCVRRRPGLEAGPGVQLFPQDRELMRKAARFPFSAVSASFEAPEASGL